MKTGILPVLILAAALSPGCGTYPTAGQAVFDGGSAVQTRSYQERVFETADRAQTLRAVIATLQDLGFLVEKADATIGTVAATKYAGYDLRATVTVRPRGTRQVLVRLNAQFSPVLGAQASRPLEDAGAYQDFFTALSKTLFLEAQDAC